jgi:hypothetical protein
MDLVHDRVHGGAHGPGDGGWPEVSSGIKTEDRTLKPKKPEPKSKKCELKKPKSTSVSIFENP